jgi:ParB family chromosome partitioning protein
MVSRQANRLIAAAQVTTNLRPIGLIPATESQARPLTTLEPEAQREVWQRAVETAPNGKVTAAHVQTVVNHYRTPLPLTAANHAPSADPDYDGDEWYTPANVIAHARNVFGGVIDLDPATNQAAQAVINATAYYTKADNGLQQPWHGNVWLNPPYSMPLVAQFVDRAMDAYRSGEIDAAIILTNNSSDTRWFQALLRRCPVCLPAGRLDFWRSNQQSFAARQGQAIFYMGIDRPAFVREFSAIGAVLEAI